MNDAVDTIAGDTARVFALRILLECRRGDAFVQEVLDDALAEATLLPADRRLVMQLTYGVIRRRDTLDALLRPLVRRRPHEVEAWLWDALRLGAYQLLLLDHIPSYAAINETVELASAARRPKSKAFLNGVLRALGRLLTDVFGDTPAADAVPVEGGRYRRLTRPVLPEPHESALEYLAQGFSLPNWLAERWITRYSWDECLGQGFWFAGPAPLWLRCNRLRVDRARFLAALADAGIAATAGDVENAVRLQAPSAVRDLPGYAEGWFSVQDESAMRVALALNPLADEQVLDMCAAPGGKTAHLAELMDNRGRIIACDVDRGRLETLTNLCGRLGIGIVQSRLLRQDEEPPAGPFDAVLVDVPCSNTGVLGRRPEARWRLGDAQLQRLVPLQTKLLIWACERVRPGGRVVYSTCSVEPEENQEIVRRVIEALPGFALEAEESQVPGRAADGGYWARLRKQS